MLVGSRSSPFEDYLRETGVSLAKINIAVGQRMVSLKYAARSSMSRPALLERVKLELELLRGLRLLLLCAAVFSIVVYASSIEKRSEYRLGLLVGSVKAQPRYILCQFKSCLQVDSKQLSQNSYKSTFSLDEDNLAGILHRSVVKG